VPATRGALAKAGLGIDEIDLFEINEAFAVVAEKYIRDLKLDRDKVNVNGGSIALGHPIGATGSILIGTLLKRKALQSKAISLKNLRVTSLSMLKWQLRARPGGHSVGVGINTLQSEG
jgi:acetyl-CoA acetyltransferase